MRSIAFIYASLYTVDPNGSVLKRVRRTLGDFTVVKESKLS